MTAGDAHDALLAEAVRSREAVERGPWYRRRGFVVAAGVAAVLAVTVVTDLPAPASRASDIAGARTVVTDVNNDLRACGFAVHEAIALRRAEVAGSITASSRGETKRLLGDDQVACSLVNSSVFDVSNIDIPGSAVGRPLGQIVASATAWAIQDALGTVVAVQALLDHPRDAAALMQLRSHVAGLIAKRASAIGSLRDAEAILRTRLPALDLPAVSLPASDTPPITP